MFSSFRFGEASKRDSKHIQPSSSNRVNTRGYTLVACDLCRARKVSSTTEARDICSCTSVFYTRLTSGVDQLKCSGEAGRCERCQVSGSACTYSQSAGFGAGRRKNQQSSMAQRISDKICNRCTSKPAAVSTSPGPQPAAAGSRSADQSAANQDKDTSTAENMPSLLSHPTSTSNSSTGSMVDPSSWPDLDVDFGFADASMLMADDQYGREPCYQAIEMGDGILSGIPDSPITPHLALPLFPEQTTVRDNHMSPGVWINGIEPPSGVPPPSESGASQRQSTSMTLVSDSRSVTEAGACSCLNDMVQQLEEVGVQQACPEVSRIDTLLMCLQWGLQLCNKVLSCLKCRICADNPMLVAIVAQQLSALCCDIPSLMAQGGGNTVGDGPGGVSGGHSSAKLPSKTSILEGGIWFGRYSVEAPEMRDLLVQRLILLHLRDLQPLMGRIKDKVGHKHRAWKMVVEADESTTKVCNTIRKLESTAIEGKGSNIRL